MILVLRKTATARASNNDLCAEPASAGVPSRNLFAERMSAPSRSYIVPQQARRYAFQAPVAGSKPGSGWCRLDVNLLSASVGWVTRVLATTAADAIMLVGALGLVAVAAAGVIALSVAALAMLMLPVLWSVVTWAFFATDTTILWIGGGLWALAAWLWDMAWLATFFWRLDAIAGAIPVLGWIGWLIVAPFALVLGTRLGAAVVALVVLIWVGSAAGGLIS